MRLRRLLQVAVAVLILAVGLTPGSAQADVAVATSQLTCSSFTASGTSNGPYVTLYADNSSTSSYRFIIVPVVAGAFTGTVSFPTAAIGTSFDVEVWGSLNTYTNFSDPGYYDDGAFFEATEESSGCAPAPTLSYLPLASLTVLLGLAGWFAIRRSAA